jgi:hypothetical protein
VTVVSPGRLVVLFLTVLAQSSWGYSELLFPTVQVQVGSGSVGILGGTRLSSHTSGRFGSSAGGVHLPPREGLLTSWSGYQA